MPSVSPPQTFDCDICGLALKTQRELARHRCLAHDDCDDAFPSSPITFRCATCGRTFARRSRLLAHLRTHTGPREPKAHRG